MNSIISINNLSKTYEGGFQALKNISLDIKQGEILALLGPNGAGKTTLISIICGLVSPTSGSVSVDGYDIITEFRQTRSRIGLVPQELTTDAFESVWTTVTLTRGLFGKKRDDAFLAKVLQDLSLDDKRNDKLRTLSGGMKRRVMIAKALSHQPKILFLDEPSAGVDVELRKDMWQMVRDLRDAGVTIILTTHYIEEAEEIADRVGVINNGELLLVENKSTLMKKFGKKSLTLHLQKPRKTLPKSLAKYDLTLSRDGQSLLYTYDTQGERTGITSLLGDLAKTKISFKDLDTSQRSLEDIFVTLVQETKQENGQ